MRVEKESYPGAGVCGGVVLVLPWSWGVLVGDPPLERLCEPGQVSSLCFNFWKMGALFLSPRNDFRIRDSQRERK